jgi:hypothetical protein
LLCIATATWRQYCLLQRRPTADEHEKCSHSTQCIASLAEVYTGATAISEDLLWKAASTKDEAASADVLTYIERLFSDACGLLSRGENGVNLTLAAIHIALSRLYTEQSNVLGKEQSQAMSSKAMMAAKQACWRAGVGKDLPSEARCVSERLIVGDGIHHSVASSALLQFAQCCGPL